MLDGRAAKIVGHMMTVWLGSTQPRLERVEFPNGWVPRSQSAYRTLPPEPLMFIACLEAQAAHLANQG